MDTALIGQVAKHSVHRADGGLGIEVFSRIPKKIFGEKFLFPVLPLAKETGKRDLLYLLQRYNVTTL